MSDTPQVPTPGGMRERLLVAAEQVVAQAGAGNLTLEAVARQARVSKGGLLYHFPSKESLITAVVDRLAARCEADQTQVLAEQSRTTGSFTRAYLMARMNAQNAREAPTLTALLAAVGTDPHYLEPIRRRFTQWQQRLETDGIDPVIACIVRLTIDGLSLCQLLDLPVPEGELRQKVLDTLLAMTEESGAQCSIVNNVPGMITAEH